MANLTTVVFTKLSDSAISPIVSSLYEGWTLDRDQTINTLPGNDTIAGGLSNFGTLLTDDGHDVISAPKYRGVINYETGTINTGEGKDTIMITQDTESSNDTMSITCLMNGGLIDLGNGDDTILISGNHAPTTQWREFGITNVWSGKILTGNGDDVIKSILAIPDPDSAVNPYVGMMNAGLLDTGEGSDTIFSNGYLINQSMENGEMDNACLLLTGPGDDSISSTVFINQASVDTGTGHDTINGLNEGRTYVEKESRFGFVNAGGIVSLGNGNDQISGRGPLIGLINHGKNADMSESIIGGIIDTGSGNDTITGISDGTFIEPSVELAGEWSAVYGLLNDGRILLGGGDDQLSGSGGGVGIANNGTIDAGSGRDVLTGIGSQGGIYNMGSILTGRGKDTVDALEGGFLGEGTLNLGEGNDIVMGFGTGHFVGGDGIDTMIFMPGTYNITDGMVFAAGVEGMAGVERTYLISNADHQMIVSQFERFGKGADHTHFSDAVLAGQVTFL